MTDELKIDLLEVLVKHGLISETAFRNEKIMREYKRMLEDHIAPGLAHERLAEKYCTSVENVRKIIYFIYGKKENEE